MGHAAVNRIRRVNRQLRALTEQAGGTHAKLAEEAKSPADGLSAIERVLVDLNRESPRDVLRHPAGLNDTLVDLINTVAIAGMSPTAQATAVSRETMDQVDADCQAEGDLVGRCRGDKPDRSRSCRPACRGVAHARARKPGRWKNDLTMHPGSERTNRPSGTHMSRHITNTVGTD
jgi:hypothetical protein